MGFCRYWVSMAIRAERFVLPGLRFKEPGLHDCALKRFLGPGGEYVNTTGGD